MQQAGGPALEPTLPAPGQPFERDAILKRDKLFVAHLEPLPLAGLETWPGDAGAEEWERGLFKAREDVGGPLAEVVSDLDLLVRDAYVRVDRNIYSQQLYLSLYLVPFDLPDLRKSGIRSTDNHGRARHPPIKTLKSLLQRARVLDQPLCKQLQSHQSLLHAWNALPSSPPQDQLQHLEGPQWPRQTIKELYTHELPLGILKAPYVFQRNDIAAMLLAEHAVGKVEDISCTPITDERGQQYYMDDAFTLKSRVGKYQLPSGGILANMPGSGKTLEISPNRCHSLN